MESFKGLSGSFYDITRVAHGGNHIIRPKKNKINCILDSNHKLSDGIDYFWILLVPLSLFQPFFYFDSKSSPLHQKQLSSNQKLNTTRNHQLSRQSPNPKILFSPKYQKITLQWLLESFISILYGMTSPTRFGFGHFLTVQSDRTGFMYRINVLGTEIRANN